MRVNIFTVIGGEGGCQRARESSREGRGEEGRGERRRDEDVIERIIERGILECGIIEYTSSILVRVSDNHNHRLGRSPVARPKARCFWCGDREDCEAR